MPWTGSANGPSRSSSVPTRPKASKSFPADGSSKEPSHGSDAAVEWPRIGRKTSPAPRPGSSSPTFAESHVISQRHEIITLVLNQTLRFADVDRFACHPGGAKVITALERALALDQGSLGDERDVLTEYGNMSAPTALFILDRLIRAGLPDRTVLTALRPGFRASRVSLQAAA